MAAVEDMTTAVIHLVRELEASWPAELRSEFAGASSNIGLALAEMIAAANRGEVASLPYVRAGTGQVYWLSFGPDPRLLLEYADDLRSWVHPYYDTQGSSEFIQPGARGQLASAVASVSPHGYLKWRSTTLRLMSVLDTLRRMHLFLASRPRGTSERVPSASTLRFRFVSAVRIGDWDRAQAVIDEIDRWNLEPAQKTMQMRIRLLDARGAYDRLLVLVERHQAWAVTNPRRISAAILLAVHRVLLRPLEAAGRYADALETFRVGWFPRLTQAIADTTGMPEPAALHAYASCIDNDVPMLQRLLPSLEPELAAFVKARLPEVPALTPAPVAPADDQERAKPVGEAFWEALHTGVRTGRQDRVRVLLDALDSELLSDAQFVARAPDALLELFSDPDLEARPVSRMLLHDTLTGLIDSVVDAPGFPRIQHLDVYVVLCEGLVYLRGAAANEGDSQLLLGLVSAIIHLTPGGVHRCDPIVRAWWGQRPTVSRLPWLAGVLDVIAPLHPSPQKLYDLFSGALDLAARKRCVLTRSEQRTWRRIADSLEVPSEAAQALLLPLTPPADQSVIDELRGAGLRRIAIVSLQEVGAREAARELAERSGAEVSVVNSLVQGAMTRGAETADLVLFVWAACSHAVYRAFDDCRERLAYVQGTGASSIVSAAENWAQKRRIKE